MLLEDAQINSDSFVRSSVNELILDKERFVAEGIVEITKYIDKHQIQLIKSIVSNLFKSKGVGVILE